MNFRFRHLQALLLSGLLLGFCLAAKAQSAAGGQHILFSAPDGQIASNTPLPMAQAPEPRDTPNLPAGEGAVAEFSAPPAPLFLAPPVVLQPDTFKSSDSLDDPMDFRKKMRLLTPAQIMNVPTPEQIFGLAEKPAQPQKNPFESQDTTTNTAASDPNAITAEPGWARFWSGDTDKSPQSSNTTENASGLLGGFFDTARNDNLFGSHSGSDADTVFGSSHADTTQQSPQGGSPQWESQLINGDFTPTAPATASMPDRFATPAASSSEFAPQSPFVPQQVGSADYLPKLPTLPSLPGRNDLFTHPSASPSWALKPPPWTQSQTPLGTPIPLNQAR
jgi:hypothetical protein